MRAILADDIAVAAPGLIEELPVPVAPVCPEPAIDSLEAVEGIGGEEDAVREVERDHDPRPVDHRCLDEDHFMPAERERVSLLYLELAMGVDIVAEAVHEHERLLHRHDLAVRIEGEHLDHRGAEVGLQVVHDNAVEVA